jgi:hypothetical protein
MTKIVTIKIDQELTEAVWSSATDRGNTFGRELGRLARVGLAAERRRLKKGGGPDRVPRSSDLQSVEMS